MRMDMLPLATAPLDEARAVELFRALANPVRFRIVQSLAERGECIVGDLVLELPVAQSTVSEHLKVLREAGIVRGTVDGSNRCYCLAPEALQSIRAVIETLEARLQACAC
jgi:ArsR family transcriptional regulator